MLGGQSGGHSPLPLSPEIFESLGGDPTVPANYAKPPNVFPSNQVGGAYGYAAGSDVTPYGGSYAPATPVCTGGTIAGRGGNNIMQGGKRSSSKRMRMRSSSSSGGKRSSSKRMRMRSSSKRMRMRSSSSSGGKRSSSKRSSSGGMKKKWRQRGCKSKRGCKGGSKKKRTTKKGGNDKCGSGGSKSKKNKRGGFTQV